MDPEKRLARDSEVPRIDYCKHPAFSALRVTPTALSDKAWREVEVANERLSAIDGVLASKLPTSSSVLQDIMAMRRDLRVRSGELIRALFGEFMKARNDWTEWEVSILPKYFYHLKHEYHRYLRYQCRRLRYLSEIALPHEDRIDRLARDLKPLGAMAMPIDPASKQALLSEVNPFVLQLRALDARKPNKLTGMGIRSMHHRFWKLLHAAIERLNLERIAGRYHGYPVRLGYAGLSVNAVDNRYFSDRYSDVGLSSANAKGIHFDSGCGAMKAMLYLSEVTAEDGAFSYILGSNNWLLPHFRRFSGQALPYSSITLNDPQSRRLFLKLPEGLRQFSHFGNDFLHDDPQEKLLLANERTYTSETGDLILFDNRGLHRGGVLPKRERIALQLQFSPVMERVREIANGLAIKYLSDWWLRP